MTVFKYILTIIIFFYNISYSAPSKTQTLELNLTNYIFGITNNIPQIGVKSDISGLYQTQSNTNYFIINLVSQNQSNNIRLVMDYCSLYIRGFITKNNIFYYFIPDPAFNVITNITEQLSSQSVGYNNSYKSMGGFPKSISLTMLNQDIKSLSEYNGNKDIKQSLSRIIVSVAEALRFKALYNKFYTSFSQDTTYVLNKDDHYYIHNWSKLSKKALFYKDPKALEVLSLAKSQKKKSETTNNALNEQVEDFYLQELGGSMLDPTM
ncbi:MAG: ribosome-inactivating family protein [Brevinemataceae bacterium]